MADEEFRHPRLAAIYDALDPDRSDLVPYLDLVAELVAEPGAATVLDVGCGTGTLALLLAERGHDVIGVDPAAASLAVAHAKPGAGRVRWVQGDATAVTVTDRDVAVMTANVAQAIVDPDDWFSTLHAIHAALRPAGHLVFETRDPAARGWLGWTRAATLRTEDVPGVGTVTTWVEVLAIDGPLVTFRGTWRFESDGVTLTSDSTLRWRGRTELELELSRAGFTVTGIRDAPDRPGRELVVIARRD